jgi:probable phosphoglycerate mutase
MNHEGPRIVFVAHSGANAVSLGHLLGIEPVPWEWERFVAFHASVSVVRPMHIASSLSFSLFKFSDTEHLPKELQTR